MKNILKYKSLFFAILLISVGCSDPDHEMGDLTAPSNIVLHADIIGQDEEHPYGDGSGDVKLTVTADNGVSYKIDYGKTEDLNLVSFPSQQTVKYTKTGVHTYTITIVAYGPGGTPTMVTRELTIESIFDPAPEITTALVGEEPEDPSEPRAKTWVINSSVPGHFGVGPGILGIEGDPATISYPYWWSAPVDAKADTPCVYSSTFTFTQVSGNEYTLDVDTPDGAFTKRGEYTSLPGIPNSGDSLPGSADSGNEGCYDEYTGGTSEFSFVPSSSQLDQIPDVTTTRTSIQLEGNETYIGYGAVSKEYEILEISENSMHLRVRGYGPEINNAWYLILKPAE